MAEMIFGGPSSSPQESRKRFSLIPEIEELLFDLHTRFCPIVDTVEYPYKQEFCNSHKDELRKAINAATHSLITHAMQQIEAGRDGDFVNDHDRITWGAALDRSITILQSLLPEQNK